MTRITKVRWAPVGPVTSYAVSTKRPSISAPPSRPHPATRFVLVGGYGGGAEIERGWMADALWPYRDQVHFTGWLSPGEVARWYCAADILVIPSWYEPFGMVVLEGMLHGLPIAATSVGGPAEILRHGRTGLLFPPKDAGALANTLLNFITNTGLRKQIGSAAAEEVRRRWLWPYLVKQMREVYREAALTRWKQQGLGMRINRLLSA